MLRLQRPGCDRWPWQGEGGQHEAGAPSRWPWLRDQDGLPRAPRGTPRALVGLDLPSETWGQAVAAPRGIWIAAGPPLAGAVILVCHHTDADTPELLCARAAALEPSVLLPGGPSPSWETRTAQWARRGLGPVEETLILVPPGCHHTLPTPAPAQRERRWCRLISLISPWFLFRVGLTGWHLGSMTGGLGASGPQSGEAGSRLGRAEGLPPGQASPRAAGAPDSEPRGGGAKRCHPLCNRPGLLQATSAHGRGRREPSEVTGSQAHGGRMKCVPWGSGRETRGEGLAVGPSISG